MPVQGVRAVTLVPMSPTPPVSLRVSRRDAWPSGS